MTSIRGYVIERRRCPEGPTGYPLPNLAPAKYNSNAIHAWGNTIWSCGAGGEGRTGLETRKDVNEWKRVPYFTEKNMSVTSAALGQSFSIFLLDTGEVYVAGYNRKGQLGDGKIRKWEQLKPQKVPLLKNVIHVAAGLDSCFALTRTRNVFAWGSGKHGKLGLNDCEDKFVPQLVVELSTGGNTGVVEIVAGAHHAHAITSGGALFSWGLNKCGQLGLGNNVSFVSKPTIVMDFKRWKGSVIGISTSSKFSAAIVKIPKHSFNSRSMEYLEKNAKLVNKLLKARRLFNIRVTKFESTESKVKIWKKFLKKVKYKYSSLKKIADFATQLRTVMKEEEKEAIKQKYENQNNNDNGGQIDTIDIDEVTESIDQSAAATEEALLAQEAAKVVFEQSYKSYLKVYETFCKTLGQLQDTTVMDSNKIFLLEKAKQTLKDFMTKSLNRTNNEIENKFETSDEMGIHSKLQLEKSPYEQKMESKASAEILPLEQQQQQQESHLENNLHYYNHDSAVFVWGHGDINLGLGETETKWYTNPNRKQQFRHQYIPKLHRILSTLRKIQYTIEDTENEKKEEDPNLFTGVHSIALGTEHGLALTTDQRVFVWGKNNYGQCGYRTTLKLKVYQDLYAPKEIIYLKGTVQIAAGSKLILEAPLYVYF